MKDRTPSAAADREAYFQYLVQALQDKDRRVYTLQTLGEFPIADERIVPYLKELLTDTTTVIISMPLLYGELRWLAAHALWREYVASGIESVVELYGIPRPLNANELAAFFEDDTIRKHLTGPEYADDYAKLRDMGLIPRVDLVLATS